MRTSKASDKTKMNHDKTSDGPVVDDDNDDHDSDEDDGADEKTVIET